MITGFLAKCPECKHTTQVHVPITFEDMRLWKLPQTITDQCETCGTIINIVVDLRIINTQVRKVNINLKEFNGEKPIDEGDK